MNTGEATTERAHLPSMSETHQFLDQSIPSASHGQGLALVRKNPPPSIPKKETTQVTVSRKESPFVFLFENVSYNSMTRYLDFLFNLTDHAVYRRNAIAPHHSLLTPVEFKALADMYLSHFCSKGFKYPEGSGPFGQYCWYETDLDRMVCT
jgi:hypothetical protein